MPKCQFVDPAAVRAKGTLSFADIPLNQYDTPFGEAIKRYTKADLLGIYHDMQVIREFEGMLYSVRTTKQYNGVEYVYTGPAHLHTGQEAAAVGLAYTLDADDMIFGSHRSHGEVLAKGYAAIKQTDDDTLYGIMKDFIGGAALAAVEKHNKTGDVKDLASDFLLYGFMAELFGRTDGFTRGLGNSMHVFFTPFGIYPNNAIVGGSAGVAAGAGLFKRVNGKPGMVVCNIGDGSLGCGPVWEALNFAAQGQFCKLWDEAHRGGLPVIFNFLNNQYGMGGQTSGETMAFDLLARVGAGISPSQLHAERVDGYNVFAVIDAFERKRKIIENREGPVLLDTVTYRYAGHSATDASTYREKEEIEAWQAVDSIRTFKESFAMPAECGAIENGIRERITKIMRLAIEAPRMDLHTDPDAIRRYMFSNVGAGLSRPEIGASRPEENAGKHDGREDPAPTSGVLIPKEQNPRLQKIKTKSRIAHGVSKLKQYNIRDALFEAIIDKFYDDPTLIAFGEDNRDWGGAFGVYGGLTESIPYHRFFNTPISEGTIVAAAVGYALCGGRAIPELMYCDFLGRAGDEVFNQLAKWQAMSAGALQMPVVLRVSVGSKYGAQHAQDWTSLVTHIPGLKVVYPATPYDAKGLMTAALNGSDPVVFFEAQKLYDTGELFNEVPEGCYEIPIGEPDVKRVGTDITILTVGASLYTAIEAAELLKERHGMSAEVIDARSLVPFNYQPVVESVQKTGRIVLVSDACERGAHIGDMARTVTELCFDYLDAPPVAVAAPNVICPCPELEEWYYPQAGWLLDAIHEKILPLPGHTVRMNYTNVEKIRREKLGV
ncbi:MAG: thiamine pyrophosphate-dependent enzyme [Oscillospiraceae bacterium]|nr:thiamine pyrophosphate-dependent enzyme [Oscillospiraceae bacterium]